MPLTPEELQRYARHLSLKEIGQAGQEKIKAAKVLCIGAGGLGSAAIQYLSAAGIGTLGIIDDDIVSLSNLQRQVIYSHAMIGQPKVMAAETWIKANNPNLNIIIYQQKLTAENALPIIDQYDLVLDCTDNYASRYLINDACFFANKPNISASILEFDGQISIFCAKQSACYRCLFPDMPPRNVIPNCVEAGVLGVLPGILGILQATEALKLIVNMGEALFKRLLTVNLLTMEFNTFMLERNRQCALCGDNPQIKSLHPINLICTMDIEENIDVPTLRKELEKNPNLMLIDIRELFELQVINKITNAIHMPQNTIPPNLQQLPRNEKFIIYCKSGYRSQIMVDFLRKQGFNCANLLGGIEAWNSL